MPRSASAYSIIDEPRPGPLKRFAMNPMLPFLGYMLFLPVGAGLFVLNALALRGRTMAWEIGFALIGLALYSRIWLLAPGLKAAHAAGWFSLETLDAWAFTIKYLMLLPLAVGLWLGYKVFIWQSASYEIHTYFDSTSAERTR
jgi:hypothetical protein